MLSVIPIVNEGLLSRMKSLFFGNSVIIQPNESQLARVKHKFAALVSRSSGLILLKLLNRLLSGVVQASSLIENSINISLPAPCPGFFTAMCALIFFHLDSIAAEVFDCLYVLVLSL